MADVLLQIRRVVAIPYERDCTLPSHCGRALDVDHICLWRKGEARAAGGGGGREEGGEGGWGCAEVTDGELQLCSARLQAREVRWVRVMGSKANAALGEGGRI